MQKLPLIIAAASLTGLVACTPPPPPPPPRFHPTPPYPPAPVDPYGASNGDTTQTSPPPVEPPVRPQPGPTVGGYPTATKTADPNQVLSPYEPYNVIDVAGFKSGQLARDPSNQKIFRVP